MQERNLPPPPQEAQLPPILERGVVTQPNRVMTDAFLANVPYPTSRPDGRRTYDSVNRKQVKTTV